MKHLIPEAIVEIIYDYADVEYNLYESLNILRQAFRNQKEHFVNYKLGFFRWYYLGLIEKIVELEIALFWCVDGLHVEVQIDDRVVRKIIYLNRGS